MPSLAEAATLFLYGYFEHTDGKHTPDLTDRRGASIHQVAAALVMELVLHERLRLEQPYVLGRLKRRRRSYRVIATSIVVLVLVVMLALFIVPIFVFASSFSALSKQMWAAAAYVGIYFGVWAVMLVLLFVLVGRPLNRWLSGKIELVEPYDPDDLRQLTIQHVQRLGQKKPTFDYVRYAFTGREQRELREKLKQQLLAQGCLVEQERTANFVLRALGDGRAVNREHPVWLALREQLRALILERRVINAQTVALAILLSARGRPDLTKQTSWTVAGLYQCFAPHEYAIVSDRQSYGVRHRHSYADCAVPRLWAVDVVVAGLCEATTRRGRRGVVTSRTHPACAGHHVGYHGVGFRAACSGATCARIADGAARLAGHRRGSRHVVALSVAGAGAGRRASQRGCFDNGGAWGRWGEQSGGFAGA